MRHRKKNKIFDRPSSQLNLLKRSMAISMISAERIKTTVAKAKWLSPFVEKCITISKKKNLASRRRLLSLLNNRTAVNKLMNELNKRFQGRTGGYTRVVKIGKRQGDGAEIAIVEFVDGPAESVAIAPTKKTKKELPKKEKEKDHEKK